MKMLVKMLRNIVNFLEKEKTKKIKFTREYTVPERDADRIKRKADAEIEKVITSEDSPVGIDAKKTHIIIINKLVEIEKRLDRLEKMH